MLKFFFKRYKKQLLDLFMDDFFGCVPADAQEEFLTIMAEKKNKVKRWHQYISYFALRKSKEHPELAEMYYHWIMFSNFQMNLIEKANLPKEDSKGKVETVVVGRTFEDDINGVKAFITKKK